MVWFKVDDKLHDHRKARAAGPAAMGVWVLAGSWSADNLTDGFIPATVLTRWGRPRDATRLVEVGLWHATEQDGEKGWRFHEWTEMQPTRAQKMAEREAKAEAGRIGGLRSGRSRREASTKQGASRLVEPPSRPVPTTSADADVVPAQAPAAAAADKPKRPTRRAQQRPPDFAPTPGHIQLAADVGVDLRTEWPKFCDYHDAKGSTFKDWPAALRTWIRNAATFNARRNAGGRSNGIDWDAAFARARAMDQASDQAAIGELG